jgi:signal transduction histidine kinase/CheY-like chemotaxis protein
METLRSAPSVDFQRLFESAPGLYLVLGPGLEIVAASDAYLGATMTTRDGIVGRRLFDVFPDNPGDPKATGVANLRASLDRVLTLGRPDAMGVQKYDIRRPGPEDGFEERYWSPINSPVFGTDGVLVYIIHKVEDVTDYVLLKLEGAAPDRKTVELAARAGHMEVEIFRRAQEIQRANAELRALHGDLESRVESRTAELLGANEELQRQITERARTEAALHRSEEQLRQSQKLEAIGRLAGGIAHDFNNLLSVILGYVELGLERLDHDSPVKDDLAEIGRAAGRAGELTKQLLAFGRQQILEPKVLDLRQVVAGVMPMLSRLIGEDIEIGVPIARGHCKVKADRGQIEQVIMNLAVNARDAMPKGGKLTLAISNAELDAVYAQEHDEVAPGRYVLLSVSDTGIGMSKDVQSRVFEPFFTTKERGKGTGLGLATVFGIVKQSGGHISVYSELGSGTTFKVYLPHADGESAPAEPDAPATVQPGTETVLVVDDDQQVRSVATAILRRAGYHVLEASSCGDALLISEQHPVKIHVLLTDVVMPKMSGRDLAARIVARHPEIRPIFMSGYASDAVVHHGVLESGLAFLQKPFTPATLTRKVREVLDGRARTH